MSIPRAVSGKRERRIAALLVLVLALGAFPFRAAAQAAAVETLISFDASQLETPESLVFDHTGNLFISLALTGEIRRIAPDGSQSTFAQLPIGPPLTPCGGFFAIMGGVTIDEHGTLYVAVAACDPQNRGIWKVTSDGQTELLGSRVRSWPSPSCPTVRPGRRACMPRCRYRPAVTTSPSTSTAACIAPPTRS